MDEHELIARHFRPLARDPAALGLVDDAAVLRPPPDCDLVLTTDGITEGVHFLPGEAADTVARKALRVNLSDLAAMGAEPLGYLLLLGLPQGWSEEWVARFAASLAADQRDYGIALYGGDTIRTAALTVSITALGALPTGSAVLRSGARPGDVIFVSGTVGDGALGLLVARGGLKGLSGKARAFLADRYRQPRPRCPLAPLLRAEARAAIDISDGLAGDLDKLCRASGVSARIEIPRVPLSQAARAALAVDGSLLDLCLTGGDDYEILCTVAPDRAADFAAAAAAAGVAVAAIGEIVAGEGPAKLVDEGGNERRLARRSFSHLEGNEGNPASLSARVLLTQQGAINLSLNRVRAGSGACAPVARSSS